MPRVSTPSSRRRPQVPPLSQLDAPIRRAGSEAGEPLWAARGGDGADVTADRGPGSANPANPANPADAAVDQAADAAVAAQRAVAEERAAVARAVLAERAALVGAAAGRSWPRRLAAAHPAAGPVVLTLAAVLVLLRLWLVGSGTLFGAAPVHALDVAVAASVALALALTLSGRRPASHRAAAVLAVPVLVVAGLTVLVPATPTSAPAAACPAAPVRGAAFVGVTLADEVTRSGPGRAYPTSGRFPVGCAVGFAGWCPGDVVPDRTWPAWASSRWLLVDRPEGPAALVARHVSGVPAARRFLPSGAVAPGGSLAALPVLSTADCGRELPRPPGETALDDVRPGPLAGNLSARAPWAANVGFALWVAPDPATGAVPLRNGTDYRQVGGTHGDVSGAAGAAGRRTVSWDHQALVRDLDVRRRTERVTVAVLAIGCEAPAVPTDLRTAAVTRYAISGGQLSPRLVRLRGYQIQERTDPALQSLDLDRLARVACQPPH